MQTAAITSKPRQPDLCRAPAISQVDPILCMTRSPVDAAKSERSDRVRLASLSFRDQENTLRWVIHDRFVPSPVFAIRNGTFRPSTLPDFLIVDPGPYQRQRRFIKRKKRP